MKTISDIREVWAHIHIDINKGKDKKKCICARYMSLDQGLSNITTC
ncbi:hypothetical protein ACJIZ3_011279 [Penstemon smallii]|uniref:Uncharacterized protein n=1 Tax=Penstemon smallii TaxID=265156 RepID=A0ABD3UM94_9LAMI